VEAAERNQVRKRAALAAAAAAQAKLYPPTAAAADAPAPEAFAAAPVMPPILDVNAAPPTGARAPGAGRVTPAQLVSALRGPAPLVGRCRFTVSNPALKPPAALKMKSHTLLSTFSFDCHLPRPVGAVGRATPASARRRRAPRLHQHPISGRQQRMLATLKNAEKPNLASNSVIKEPVRYIFSKRGDYLLEDRDQVGLSANRRWIFQMASSDWSNGIRYHTFNSRPDTEFK